MNNETILYHKILAEYGINPNDDIVSTVTKVVYGTGELNRSITVEELATVIERVFYYLGDFPYDPTWVANEVYSMLHTTTPTSTKTCGSLKKKFMDNDTILFHKILAECGTNPKDGIVTSVINALDDLSEVDHVITIAELAIVIDRVFHDLGEYPHDSTWVANKVFIKIL